MTGKLGRRKKRWDGNQEIIKSLRSESDLLQASDQNRRGRKADEERNSTDLGEEQSDAGRGGSLFKYRGQQIAGDHKL